MQTISSRQSSVINIMKGLLPILVVAFHTSVINGTVASPGFETYLRMAICKLGEIAVPTFFVISGYLFFLNLQKWDWEVWNGKLKKRAKTLLTPFLIWIVIDFAAKFIWGTMKSGIAGFNFHALEEFYSQSGGMRIFWDRPIQEFISSIFSYPVDMSKPINGSLWYVRDLMVMVLLAPLVWKVLKSAKVHALAVLFLIYILFIGFPFVLATPTALFFFSLGAYFSIRGENNLECFNKYKTFSYLLSSGLFVMTFFINGTVWGNLVSRLFVAASVVAVFNLSGDLYDKGLRPSKLLTDSSFFIYASHAVLIMEIANFLLWRALPITAEWMLVLKVFLRPALTVGICLLLYVAMKRFSPRTLALITGGRG